MTIGEMIKERIDAMPRDKQQKALSFVKRLEGASHRKTKRPRSSKPSGNEQGNYKPKDPGLRAIAGMWKGRTDLPKDSVQAVKAIRARMWSRSKNA